MTIYWAVGSMRFSSCSYCLFVMLMHLLIWSFQKPKGLLPNNWWNQKKQRTHLTPIILPIISGFHLLPSVFVIYTLSKVRENIKTLRALPQLNFGDLRLHGFEAYKQRGKSIWSAYKKRTWISIRIQPPHPKLVPRGAATRHHVLYTTFSRLTD